MPKTLFPSACLECVLHSVCVAFPEERRPQNYALASALCLLPFHNNNFQHGPTYIAILFDLCIKILPLLGNSSGKQQRSDPASPTGARECWPREATGGSFNFLIYFLITRNLCADCYIFLSYVYERLKTIKLKIIFQFFHPNAS